MLRVIGNDQNLPRQEHAVASGALTNGKPVIVNSDGTVSVVSSSSVSQALGTAVTFLNDFAVNMAPIYDSDSQKIVIAYRDVNNSNYGTAIVGTVNASDNSISFGSPAVFETARAQSISAAYDTNAQKVVISYSDNGNGNRGTVIIGTVSGTSISFGTAVLFDSDGITTTSTTYDPNEQKIVISYHDDGNNSYGTSIVGTVSGTSISFGSAVVFNAGTTFYISSIYDTNAQKVVIAYRDASNSDHGTAIVGTVSGTSISFGTEVVFEAAASNYVKAIYDSSNNKVVIAYRDDGNSSYGTAIVGTVSGTSISFGSASVFESGGSANHITGAYDANVGKVVIAYEDEANSEYGTVVSSTVSGTSISFDTPTVFSESQNADNHVVYDANAKKSVIVFRNQGNSNYGTSIVFQASGTVANLTSENYIGIARSGVADTAKAIIDTQGAIADNLSGLTAGQSYYVQNDGTLGTTADDPSVFAGTAVSATKLIVKG
jgi:hypothetical protein